MTTLYLVRHGETVDNVSQILQGQTGGRLTEHGKEQARRLRDELSGKRFDALLSSDLSRAYDTAVILNEAFGLEIDRTELLRERDWGDFTGKPIADIQDKEFPENVESLNDMQTRAYAFIAYVRKKYPDMHVIAVGHGLFNRCIQAVYYKTSMRKIPRMENTEVRILSL